MSEHEVDIELIMALAEGSLAPDEAAAAESRLDAAGRAELAAQRSAIAALRDAPSISLAAHEREALRSAVRQELHLDSRPASISEPTRTPRLWRMLPALGAAAALVVVVGVGLSSLGGGDDADETAADLGAASLEAEAAETTAAAAATLAGVDRATPPMAVPEAGAALDVEEAADDAASETAQSADQSFAADGIGLVPDLGELASTDRDVVSAAVAAGVDVAGEAFPYALARLGENADAAGQFCWTSIVEDLSFGEITLTANATLDGEPVELYVIDDGQDSTAYILATRTCELTAELLLEN